MTKILFAAILAGIGVMAFHSFPGEFRDVWYFVFIAAVWSLALSLLISLIYGLLKSKRLN